MLFENDKPVIGVIHLLPLPGAPAYAGNVRDIKDRALKQAGIYQQEGLDGVIVENFGDAPFFKNGVPPETTACLTAVLSEIANEVDIPYGVNVLRNDALSALGIACATGASFIRVNVHSHAVITDQGMIEGDAARTLRKRRELGADIQIWADVWVKHAAPLADIGLEDEVRDVQERGMADAVIVTGGYTGAGADLSQLEHVKSVARRPVYIGSGMAAENLSEYYGLADGFIVGSAFKMDGEACNDVDAEKVKNFMERYCELRNTVRGTQNKKEVK